MTQSPAPLVAQFHRHFDLPIATEPQIPTRELTDLRAELLREESAEAIEALAGEDVAAIAQELADVVYVAYGTALSLGVDLDAVIAEVHRANMSKLDAEGKSLKRADGKILKSDGFSAANVRSVLKGPLLSA